jgi:hypothetical protein
VGADGIVLQGYLQMTTQEQLNMVKLQSLTQLTFQAVSASGYLSGQFTDVFGQVTGPAMILPVTTTASSLVNLYRTWASLSAPALPAGSTTFTTTVTGNVYVGFAGRTDGSINPYGSTHRVLMPAGTYYLGDPTAPEGTGMVEDLDILAGAVAFTGTSFTTGDPGFDLLTVRKDNPVATAPVNQRQPVLTDANGCVWFNLNTLIAGEDITTNRLLTENRFNYYTSTTSGTVTHKSGPGTLGTMTVLGGTAGAITVYDNTTGAGSAIVPTFTPANVNVPVTLIFNVLFSTGCTVVTTAATILALSIR